MKILSTLLIFSGILTVVEVAEISCIKEEVSSKEIGEATPGSTEWEWGVKVKPSSPIRISTQVVTYTGKDADMTFL